MLDGSNPVRSEPLPDGSLLLIAELDTWIGIDDQNMAVKEIHCA